MSTSIDQAEASALQSVFINNCFLVAAIAVYAFDRCIRVGREIDLIWSRGYSLVSALYTLLEVFTVLYLGLTAGQDLVYVDCKVGVPIRAVPEDSAVQAITASYYAVIAVIATLRVYAINGRYDWRIVSAVVFPLLLLRSAYDLASAYQLCCLTGKFTVRLWNFHASYNKLTGLIVSRFYIASLVTSIAADAIVFMVIWRRTYHVARLSREQSIEASTVSSLLLRDGAIYFALVTPVPVPVDSNKGSFIRSLFILNSITIITDLKTVVPIDSMTIPLTSIIISRMLLNLREAGLQGQANSHDPSTSSHLGASQPATGISDLHFSRGVSAFGASWNDDEDGEIDEGEIVDDEGQEVEMMGRETAEIESAGA
ncbi:uncharacterized protein C8Q71DRAFT_891583 [Rhodofomes roseus]|uniref:Uncharacterized protein n=1 Tax=Rhodofomes roseus TaxID=34475 RepID=A0ABQ8JY02_9APHY|nr:uncharacterized protein C8Q71DRAFT_891583 [Rhodofomes roseus]KAH9829116.1 hypothetical protein C8Q71DRAFT_891583 [Rhodofomes roseus]